MLLYLFLALLSELSAVLHGHVLHHGVGHQGVGVHHAGHHGLGSLGIPPTPTIDQIWSLTQSYSVSFFTTGLFPEHTVVTPLT